MAVDTPALTTTDLYLVATLRAQLSDEQGRLTAYLTHHHTSLSLVTRERLRVSIERFAGHTLAGQHIELAGDGHAVDAWVMQTMTLLAMAGRIATPYQPRNDITPVPDDVIVLEEVAA